MRSASSAFKAAMKDNATLLARGTLTLADGTKRELTGDDIVDLSVESSTSSDSSFDVGAVVVGKCSLTLNNHDGRFEDYDFTEATVAAYVGKRVALPSGYDTFASADIAFGASSISDVTWGDGVEWMRVGTYVVDQPDSYSGTIQLDCLEMLTLLSRTKYSEVTQSYPCKPSDALRTVFAKCGLTLDWGADALNDSVEMGRRPDSDNMTCLQAASYLAQLMGLWIRGTDYGHGLASWYPKESSTDEAGELLRPYSSTTMTDDVVVTGVQVTASDEVTEETDSDGNVTEGNGEDGETALAGSAGYVLDLGQNPFVEYGRANEVATEIYGRVGGMTFRPFSMEHPSEPWIESGDRVTFLDRNGDSHTSYATSVSIAVNKAMSVKCSAESAARNSSSRASATTQAIVKARNELRRERTAREIAMADLAERIAEEEGLYHTEETQSDGSVVYYLHDRPTIDESKVIWKMNAQAVAVSTDGGKTYANGITADGNAVLNRIYAIGLDANYITSGRISAQNGTNFFDLDTGEMQIAANTPVASDDGTTGNIVTSVDVLYAMNDSATLPPIEGWQADPPTWEDGKFIWSKTVTVVGGTSTSTEPVCITGAKGETGERGDDGSSVTIASITYATSDSGTEAPESGWQETVPSVGQGTWLWCRTTYSDGTVADGCSYVGVDGSDGEDGTSVTVSSVAYAVSDSGDAAPTDGWQESVPSVDKGRWLWARTTYSDGTVADTCSYSGTDGEDGTSVAIRSVSKEDRTTTVVLESTDGSTRTLTIEDGEDGTNGAQGARGEDGRSSYTHVAWCMSAAGSDPEWWQLGQQWSDAQDTWHGATASFVGFSTTDGAGRTYLGVYEDDQPTDSEDPNDYTWSLIRGADGTGVSVLSVSYARSEDGGSAPASGWQETVPNVPQGWWLWVRTSYTDGTTSYTCSYVGTDGQDGKSVTVRSAQKANGTTTVVLQSSDGTSQTLSINDGEDGAQGVPGADGTSSYVHIAWATAADGSSGFSISESEGKTYLGVYRDDKEADSTEPGDYSWSLIRGADGNGVLSTTVTYGASTSPSSMPAEWSGQVPTVGEGLYLWTRTITDYTDPSTPDTVTYTYARQGANGADGTSVTILGTKASSSELPSTATAGDAYLIDGDLWVWDGSQWTDVGTIQGPAGKDGASVTVSSIAYQAGTSATTVPTGTWGSSPVTVPQGSYLWTRTTFSNGSVAYGVARQGEDGKSPTVTLSKSGDTTTITVHHVDGTTTTSTVQDGTDGTAGSNGYVHVKYSDDGGKTFTANGGETAGSWLGQYTDNTKEDADSVGRYTWYKIRGEDGKSVTVKSASKRDGVTTVVLVDSDGNETTMTVNDGEDGATGATGATGRSSYTHIAWARTIGGSAAAWEELSGAWSAQGSTWASSRTSFSGFSTTDSTDACYIGVYEDNAAADSKDPTAYTWSRIQGTSGRGVSTISDQYYLSTSDQYVEGGSWQDAQPTWRVGTYIWTRSKVEWSDGTVEYTDPVLASGINLANETSAEAKAKSDRLETNLSDLNTQEGIFNRLTNNGQTQGIYIQDHRVYINGTYIKTGVLDASLVKAGILKGKSGDSYWNMETGEAKFALSTKVGNDGTTLQNVTTNVKSAKDKTDKLVLDTVSSVTIGKDGITIVGSDTDKTTHKITYGSNGILSFSDILALATSGASLEIKDWGLYYKGSGGSASGTGTAPEFWITRKGSSGDDAGNKNTDGALHFAFQGMSLDIYADHIDLIASKYSSGSIKYGIQLSGNGVNLYGGNSHITVGSGGIGIEASSGAKVIAGSSASGNGINITGTHKSGSSKVEDYVRLGDGGIGLKAGTPQIGVTSDGINITGASQQYVRTSSTGVTICGTSSYYVNSGSGGIGIKGGNGTIAVNDGVTISGKSPVRMYVNSSSFGYNIADNVNGSCSSSGGTLRWGSGSSYFAFGPNGASVNGKGITTS